MEIGTMINLSGITDAPVYKPVFCVYTELGKRSRVVTRLLAAVRPKLDSRQSRCFLFVTRSGASYLISTRVLFLGIKLSGCEADH